MISRRFYLTNKNYIFHLHKSNGSHILTLQSSMFFALRFGVELVFGELGGSSLKHPLEHSFTLLFGQQRNGTDSLLFCDHKGILIQRQNISLSLQNILNGHSELSIIRVWNGLALVEKQNKIIGDIIVKEVKSLSLWCYRISFFIVSGLYRR